MVYVSEFSYKGELVEGKDIVSWRITFILIYTKGVVCGFVEELTYEGSGRNIRFDESWGLEGIVLWFLV